MMRISEQGLALIRKFEGLSLSAYQCPAGIWTIGYGHTSHVKEGQVITLEQAEEWLKDDVAFAEKAIHASVIGQLTQGQFDALVSFVFNVGSGAFQRSTLLKKINRGEMDHIPAQLMRWIHADGKPLQGLIRRRRFEAALWRGIDENEPLINAQSRSAPQPPQGGKPLYRSSTAWSAGASGIIAAAQGFKDVTAPLKEAVTTGEDLAQSVQILLQNPWVLAAILATLASLWILRERARHAKEEGI
jgi:lysozyme